MFPESNAPAPCQPWVRDVTNRAAATNRRAASTERNAYSLASAAKSSYALISDRIENIGSFTTGLFEQENISDTRDSYTSVGDLPVLYAYPSGDFLISTGLLKAISFNKYDELTVTADTRHSMWTTSSAVTNIGVSSGFLPMIMATVPPLASMSATGVFNPNALNYGTRWTVENFAPFVDFQMPGNNVPDFPSAVHDINVTGFHPEFSSTTQITNSKDNYTGYSMRYTRDWLMQFMEAVKDYATANSPLPAGSFYYPPDVDQVQIVLGYYVRSYIGGTTSTAYLNDSRLSFTSDTSFSLEGVRNLGY